MCGIFGIYSTNFLDQDEKEMFASLGVFSTPRGKDATGFLAVETTSYTPKGQTRPNVFYALRKAAVQPYEFFNDPNNKREVLGRNNALVGHNRHATIGNKDEDTAHPFEHGDIIGVHNGTIRNYAQKEDFSDSDRLYKKIDEVGLKAAMNELPYDSAYALVWWNVDENAFYFFRNDQRPIVYVLSKDGKKIMWASEGRFLKAAIAYHKMEDKWNTEVALLKTNCLVKFCENTIKDHKDYGKIRWSVTNDFLDKAVIEKHQRKYSGTAWTGVGGHWRGGVWSGSSTAGRTSTATRHTANDSFWQKQEEELRKKNAAAKAASTTVTPLSATGSTTAVTVPAIAGNRFKFNPGASETDSRTPLEEPESSTTVVTAGETKVEAGTKTPEVAPLQKEVAPGSTNTFQYKPSCIRGQHDKDVSYTYWPLQSKVSRRTQARRSGEYPSYTDCRPGDADFDAELQNCMRYIHNSNGGVFVSVDELDDDFLITVHLPSGKVKEFKTTDARWNGWYVLMEKMQKEWDEATLGARTVGSSSFNIRFYPWNVAHSYVAMMSNVTEDEAEEEGSITPVDESNLVPIAAGSRIAVIPEKKEEAKAKRGRPSKAQRKAGSLETGKLDAVNSFADLEVLPWSTSDEDTDEGIIVPDYYEGFKREPMSLEAATELLRCNCINCCQSHSIDDKVYWITRNSYVCEECADLPVVQQNVDLLSAYLGQRKEA